MTSILENPRAMATRDTGGMLKEFDSYVHDFLTAFERASRAPLAAPAALTDVVITGMGGSGICGNLALGLIRPDCPVPVTLLKGYDVPGFVGPKTVVLAVSYSGNTEETLSVALEARARGATLVGVSSGGRLRDLARRRPASHLHVEPGHQPRVALPHLFGTLLGAARALRLTTISPPVGLERELRDFHRALLPGSPANRNPAKQFARRLHDKFPVYYGYGPMASVAHRGRCQLNENANMLARNDDIPEANHNELVAWNATHEGERFFVAFLRQPNEPPEIDARFRFVGRVLERQGVPHREWIASASTPLARVLQGLMFVDYTSVYAAFLRGVDPNDVGIIDELKGVLAKEGRAAEIERRLR